MIASSLLLCLTTSDLSAEISYIWVLWTGITFFSFLNPPELQCAELEEYWCQHGKKTPTLETSHAIPVNHAEEGGKGGVGGGRSEGMEASLLDRKRQRQQNKGWEAMCLLSTNKHTTEGDVCRLKDKDGARSNNYEIATVK